MVHYRSKLKTT